MTGRMAAIGARAVVQGYGLAGATVAIAEDPGAVRDAWKALPPDVVVVVLSAAAAAVLGRDIKGAVPLVVVLS